MWCDNSGCRALRKECYCKRLYPEIKAHNETRPQNSSGLLTGERILRLFHEMVQFCSHSITYHELLTNVLAVNGKLIQPLTKHWCLTSTLLAPICCLPPHGPQEESRHIYQSRKQTELGIKGFQRQHPFRKARFSSRAVCAAERKHQ